MSSTLFTACRGSADSTSDLISFKRSVWSPLFRQRLWCFPPSAMSTLHNPGPVVSWVVTLPHCQSIVWFSSSVTWSVLGAKIFAMSPATWHPSILAGGGQKKTSESPSATLIHVLQPKHGVTQHRAATSVWQQSVNKVLMTVAKISPQKTTRGWNWRESGDPQSFERTPPPRLDDGIDGKKPRKNLLLRSLEEADCSIVLNSRRLSAAERRCYSVSRAGEKSADRQCRLDPASQYFGWEYNVPRTVTPHEARTQELKSHTHLFASWLVPYACSKLCICTVSSNSIADFKFCKSLWCNTTNELFQRMRLLMEWWQPGALLCQVG